MRTLLVTLMAGYFLTMTGCSGQSAAQLSDDLSSRGATGTDTGNGLIGSATVNLDNVSLASLQGFFYSSQPQNPTNVRIKVDLSQDGTGRYGGDVTIAYDENGQTHQAVVSSNHPYWDVSDNSLNVWYDFFGSGTQLFHGIFQDSYGAVVFVVDDVIDQGDGSDTGLLSGSIWYQNFGETLAPQGPEKMCWQITIGPYDCRTFISGSTWYDQAQVVTTSSLYPTTSTRGGDDTGSYNGDRPAYRKLGTFTGLSRGDSFQ